MNFPLPPKKRYKAAKLRLRSLGQNAKKPSKNAIHWGQTVKSKRVVEVRLCAGGSVGSCLVSQKILNITQALHIDCRPKHLGFDGSPVHVYARSRAHEIFQKFKEHDCSYGPFKLAAELEPGWRVPTVDDYDAEVGVLQGGWDDSKNDLQQLLNIVRIKFPECFVVVLASPPCRIASNANQRKDEEDVDEYMKFTQRFFRRIANLRRTGVCDALLIEWAAQGRHRDGVFEPGTHATQMLNQMNDILNDSFTVLPIQAADYGCPSTRKRLLFAEKKVFDFLPCPLAENEWVGWGRYLGFCDYAPFSLVTRSWRALSYNGKDPRETAMTVTTMGQHIYIDREDEEVPTLFPVSPQNLAKLIGVDPFDPNLDRLAKLPIREASILVGISFSVQWYNAVIIAQMGAANARGHYCGIHTQEHANAVYWKLEKWRRERHPKPVRGLMPKLYKLREDVKKGKVKSRKKFQHRLKYFQRKFCEMRKRNEARAVYKGDDAKIVDCAKWSNKRAKHVQSVVCASPRLNFTKEKFL